MAEVSIVMPTYNRHAVIRAAIAAICRQTFTDWELIVCDDSSHTFTSDVVAEFADRRIRYHHNGRRLGLPANRNVGISLATAPLVMFVEDDVVLDPQCLETLVLERHRIKILSSKVGAIGPRTLEPEKTGALMALERRVSQHKRQTMRGPAYVSWWTGLPFQNFAWAGSETVESPILPSWSLFDRAALLEVSGYSTAYDRWNYSHEETDMFCRLRRAGWKLYFCPRALAYHQHASTGGTRVGTLRYYWAFLGAHLLYLRRNFGPRAAYMIPATLAYLAGGIAAGIPTLVKEVYRERFGR